MSIKFHFLGTRAFQSPLFDRFESAKRKQLLTVGGNYFNLNTKEKWRQLITKFKEVIPNDETCNALESFHESRANVVSNQNTFQLDKIVDYFENFYTLYTSNDATLKLNFHQKQALLTDLKPVFDGVCETGIHQRFETVLAYYRFDTNWISTCLHRLRHQLLTGMHESYNLKQRVADAYQVHTLKAMSEMANDLELGINSLHEVNDIHLNPLDKKTISSYFKSNYKAVFFKTYPNQFNDVLVGHCLSEMTHLLKKHSINLDDWNNKKVLVTSPKLYPELNQLVKDLFPNQEAIQHFITLDEDSNEIYILSRAQLTSSTTTLIEEKLINEQYLFPFEKLGDELFDNTHLHKDSRPTKKTLAFFNALSQIDKLTALEKDRLFVKYDTELLAHPQFLLIHLKTNPELLYHLSPSVRNNQELQTEIINFFNDLFLKKPCHLNEVKTLKLFTWFCNSNRSLYSQLNENILCSEKLASALLNNSDGVFKYLDESLKNNLEIVKLAVKNNGLALNGASLQLRNNPELIQLAANQLNIKIKTYELSDTFTYLQLLKIVEDTQAQVAALAPNMQQPIQKNKLFARLENNISKLRAYYCDMESNYDRNQFEADTTCLNSLSYHVESLYKLLRVEPLNGIVYLKSLLNSPKSSDKTEDYQEIYKRIAKQANELKHHIAAQQDLHCKHNNTFTEKLKHHYQDKYLKIPIEVILSAKLKSPCSLLSNEDFEKVISIEKLVDNNYLSIEEVSLASRFVDPKTLYLIAEHRERCKLQAIPFATKTTLNEFLLSFNDESDFAQQHQHIAIDQWVQNDFITIQKRINELLPTLEKPIFTSDDYYHHGKLKALSLCSHWFEGFVDYQLNYPSKNQPFRNFRSLLIQMLTSIKAIAIALFHLCKLSLALIGALLTINFILLISEYLFSIYLGLPLFVLSLLVLILLPRNSDNGLLNTAFLCLHLMAVVSFELLYPYRTIIFTIRILNGLPDFLKLQYNLWSTAITPWFTRSLASLSSSNESSNILHNIQRIIRELKSSDSNSAQEKGLLLEKLWELASNDIESVDKSKVLFDILNKPYLVNYHGEERRLSFMKVAKLHRSDAQVLNLDSPAKHWCGFFQRHTATESKLSSQLNTPINLLQQVELH